MKALIGAQFPEWAELPVRRYDSVGSDNWMFRLGEALVVRLPRRPSAAPRIAKEAEWVPQLAPALPLAVPAPIAVGAPTDAFPWPWAVQEWLVGEDLGECELAHPHDAAERLAGFLRALQNIDAKGPVHGDHNFYRGCPLAERNEVTVDCIAQMSSVIDTGAALALWQRALEAPTWTAPWTWVHGDISVRNLLASGGRLSAVIDFGGLGLGDPACDLMPAWTVFDAAARETFRSALSPDEAMWIRGQAWAMSVAAVAWPYYRESQPRFAANCLATLGATLRQDR